MSIMEENKFERQVRQKMDELKINPSDSVWENVKSGIEKRKNRKWAFLILFFLFALLLTGGYWLYNTNHSIFIEKEISNNIKKEIEDSSFIKKSNTTEERNKTAQLNTEISKQVNKKIYSADKEVAKKQSIITIKRKIKGQKSANIVVAISSAEAEIVNRPAKIDEEIKSNEFNNKPDDGNLNNIKPGLQNELATVDSNKKNIPADKAITKKLAKQEDTLSDVSKKKSLSAKSKNRWNVGFFISGGISHIGNQFLGFGNSNADYLQALSNANPSGGIIITYPSKVKNSGGYIAGIFMEKEISFKTKFSLGINYKEFNTSTLIGQKNDTTGTYSARNTQLRYFNNFKFIELPVQLKVRLGSRNSFPVFWTGGITLSQLINSNALQFDPYTATYYKNNSLFNKTQIGLNTGFSAVLFQNQKAAILFGPYFYYSASQLAKKGLYNKKHFVFIGLHTEILFGKK